MKLKKYLYEQLSLSFFPIFLALYFITSVIFLVKIASLTSVITIDFFELFKLYSFVVPQIIFFTMPISFFISLVITLSRLSSEYELTVITSFGLNPLKILKIFLPITFILSCFLLVVSLGLIPKTKYLTKQFISLKKKEANFNIKASEFGQKFGDWLIYIQEKDGNIYKNIKLFKTKKDKEQFILSKTAVLKNDKGDLSFKLDDGKAFYITKAEINQINFDEMYINDTIRDDKLRVFSSSLIYWLDRFKRNADFDDFSFFVLTSIFPLISLFLVVTFGYFNPRYEKNRAVSYSLLAVVLYYILMKAMSENILLHSLYALPIFWLIGTYILYSKTVKKEY
ncbi:MAG: LptF/LptG family permease [Arcobacter sp.]|nr:LptF/LptG family permease [Arcobacter sp.]